MKKLISVILALVLTLSCALPASAQSQAESCGCGKSPILVISGMNYLPSVLDAGTPQERECFPPQVDVGKIVFRALGGLLRSIVTLDVKPFANTAADIAFDLLGVMACDADGNSLYNVTPVLVEGAMSTYEPSRYENAGSSEFSVVNCAVQAVGADHTYFYNYDWRLDPLTNADDLNAYIDRILRETGHEKVRLAAISMGGVQTMAYLEKYGHDKIEAIWFLSAAYCGLLFVTNIFTGEIQFNQKSFFSWLQTLTVGSDKTDKTFDACMDWCGRTALLRPLFHRINSFSEQVNSIVVDRVIRRTLSTMPGMWAFVRDDRYEEAKRVMLPENASETFIGRIDDYHYNVLCKREEILKAAEADGVQIAVVSHYNKGCVPVTSSAQAHGDSLIETVCTSGGATVADYGSTLPAGYTQHACKAHNHLSADGVIDASTCMFPDTTWFIKNMPHVGCNRGSGFAAMLTWMFGQDEMPTVFSDARYPQFLETDARTQMTLEPVR